MGKSGILTAVVAMVLGIVIGVVGLLAAAPKLSPSADDAYKTASQTVKDSEKVPPPVYGHK